MHCPAGRVLRSLATLATCLPIGLFSPIAFATSTRLATQYAERPLVLPYGTIRVDGGPKWPIPIYRLGQITATHVDDVDTWWHLNAGMTFGVLPDLELGLLVPLQLAPDLDLADPVPHLLWRFADGDFEAGFSASFVVPFEGEFVTHLGVPLRGHAGALRFDFGPFLGLNPGDRLDLILPFELGIQASRQFFLGPEVALVAPDFEGLDVPVGFFAGYTFESARGTVGDLSGRLRLFDIDDEVVEWRLMFSFDLFFDV